MYIDNHALFIRTTTFVHENHRNHFLPHVNLSGVFFTGNGVYFVLIRWQSSYFFKPFYSVTIVFPTDKNYQDLYVKTAQKPSGHEIIWSKVFPKLIRERTDQTLALINDILFTCIRVTTYCKWVSRPFNPNSGE